MESTCPICDGTGWTVVERNGLSGAKRCTCFSTARPATLLEAARIPLNYEQASLDNFKLPKDHPQANAALGRVLLQMRSYVRAFPALEPKGLLLVGETGTGKTHLAIGVLRALLAKGHQGIFYDYQTLLTHIRNGWDVASGTSDREAYRNALETEILVLDELGAHRMVEWVQDIITAIITQRCNDCKPTIVTTNLTPDEPLETDFRGSGGNFVRPKPTLSEVIGLRARSRLFEMCKVVKMPSFGDYREQNAKVLF